MNALIHNNKSMNNHLSGGLLLLASCILNVGALFSNISPILKGILMTVTVLTTIMAFFNQYKTFQKNFKTLFIVITVNRVFTFLKPKKNRHWVRSTNNKKPKDNDTTIS